MMRVGIVGAGVIGLAAACELTRRGMKVEIFDKGEPGSGASFGNATLLAVTHNLPFASPSMRVELARLLVTRHGPLRLDPRHLFAFLPWGLRFLQATRAGAAEATAQALAPLLNAAVPAWLNLLDGYGQGQWLKQRGLLYVYKDRRALASGRVDADRRRRFGARIDDVPAEEIGALEPALAGPFAGALLHPDVAQVDSPKQMLDGLASALVQAGTLIHRQGVEAIIPIGSGAGILAGGHIHAYDRVVLAAGIDSASLAADLGCRVPLESERGYHVELPAAANALSRPVGFGDAKIVLAPLQGRLRVTGIAEFAGRGRTPDWRLADTLLQNARAILPILSDAGATRWTGERPSTPDSRPVIGLAPGSPNVILAFGHGHLGLTLGAVTSGLVADLVQRGATEAARPFAADRFRRSSKPS